MSDANDNMSLVPFQYGQAAVRTVIINGEPWFVAPDVCAVLGLTNVTVALAGLDEDERSKESLGRQGETNIVNEPGLYSLILRSRKPEAKAFKRWITHEVLPALRKTGRYEVVQLDRRALAQMVIDAEDARTVAEQRVAQLAPAAEAWDQLASASGDYSVREAAQLLCRAGIPTGQNRLFASLHDLGWIDRDNQPYQAQVDNGRLARRTTSYSHPHHGEPRLSVQVRITVKGLEWLRSHLGDGGMALDLTG